jgi:hypothetical protein
MVFLPRNCTEEQVLAVVRDRVEVFAEENYELIFSEFNDAHFTF